MVSAYLRHSVKQIFVKLLNQEASPRWFEQLARFKSKMAAAQQQAGAVAAELSGATIAAATQLSLLLLAVCNTIPTAYNL